MYWFKGESKSKISGATGHAHALAHTLMSATLTDVMFSCCDDSDFHLHLLRFCCEGLAWTWFCTAACVCVNKACVFFVLPGKGGRGWSWPGSMKTDLLYGVTPDATSVHKVKANSKIQWYSSLYWSISPILPSPTNHKSSWVETPSSPIRSPSK